jgi:hypothetical protein
MPYSIVWQKNGAYRRFWRFVSKDDIRESFKELHQSPEYNQLLCILHDHSEMTGRDWGDIDITLLGANHLGASVGNHKLVDIVVTTDDDFVGIMQGKVVTKLLPNPIQFYTTLAEGRKRYEEIVGESLM